MYPKLRSSPKKETGFCQSLFLVTLRESKGRPDRREGKKVSSGHFFSPWEIPCFSRRSPEDCEWKSITRLPHSTVRDSSFPITIPSTGKKRLTNVSLFFVISLPYDNTGYIAYPYIPNISEPYWTSPRTAPDTSLRTVPRPARPGPPLPPGKAHRNRP